MRTAADILSARKDAARKRFIERTRGTTDPVPAEIPQSPEEALRMGMRLGRRLGYSDGLLDGTELGLDVGLEAVDAMLRQPVIFAEGGVA